MSSTKTDLRVYTLGGRKYRAHPGCRAGFRTDREYGLIYGPYAEVAEDGTRRFLSGPEEASMRWGQCAYCGGR